MVPEKSGMALREKKEVLDIVKQVLEAERKPEATKEQEKMMPFPLQWYKLTKDFDIRS